MSQDQNTRDAFTTFGEKVIRRSMQELNIQRQKTRIRAKWKNGRPTSIRRSRFYAKIDRSGHLKRSIRFTIEGDNASNYTIAFYIEEYGIFVNAGRMGRLKTFDDLPSKATAKGAPVSYIRQWIETKPIRARDENGAFVKMTPKRLKAMSFLINRKIKFFGIEPTHFFDDALNDSLNECLVDINQAIARDLANNIKETFENQ